MGPNPYQLLAGGQTWGTRVRDLLAPTPTRRRLLLTPEEEQATADAAAERQAQAQAATVGLPADMQGLGGVVARGGRQLHDIYSALTAPSDSLEARPGEGAVGLSAAKLSAALERADPTTAVAEEGRRVAHNLYAVRHHAENVYSQGNTPDVPEAFASFLPSSRRSLQELARNPHSAQQISALVDALRPAGVAPGEQFTARPVSTLRSMSPAIGETGVALGLTAATGGVAGALLPEVAGGEALLSAARGVTSVGGRALLGAARFLPAQTFTDVVGGTAQGMSPGEAALESVGGNVVSGGLMEGGQALLGKGLRGAWSHLLRPGAEDIVDKAIRRGPLGPNLEPRPERAQGNWEKLTQTERDLAARSPAALDQELAGISPEAIAVATEGSPENMAARATARARREAPLPTGPLEVPDFIKPAPPEPPVGALTGAQAAEQFPQLMNRLTAPVSRAADWASQLGSRAFTPTVRRAAAVAGAGALASQFAGDEGTPGETALATAGLVLTHPRQAAEALQRVHSGELEPRRLTRPEMQRLWQRLGEPHTGLRPAEREAVADMLENEVNRRGGRTLASDEPAARRAAAEGPRLRVREGAPMRGGEPARAPRIDYAADGSVTHEGHRYEAGMERSRFFDSRPQEELVRLRDEMGDANRRGQLPTGAHDMLDELNEQISLRGGADAPAGPAATAPPRTGPRVRGGDPSDVTQHSLGWTDNGGLVRTGDTGGQVYHRQARDELIADTPVEHLIRLRDTMTQEQQAGRLSPAQEQLLSDVDDHIYARQEGSAPEPEPDTPPAPTPTQERRQQARQQYPLRQRLERALYGQIEVERTAAGIAGRRKELTTQINQARSAAADAAADPEAAARMLAHAKNLETDLRELDARVANPRSWEGQFSRLDPEKKAAFEEYERLYPLPEGQRSAWGEFDKPEKAHLVLRPSSPDATGGYVHMMVSAPDPRVSGGAGHVAGLPEVEIMSAHGGRGQMTRADFSEIKKRLIERFGPRLQDEPPNFYHAGGVGQGSSDEYSNRVRRLWPGLRTAVLAALVAKGLMSQDTADGIERDEAGMDGGMLPAAAMALAAGTEHARLPRVLGGLAAAGGGYALSKLADDPDIRATGTGAMALGAASALWHTRAPQRAWAAIGERAVAHARESVHGEGFTRNLIQATNPEALLDPQVRKYIRQYEDELGRHTEEAERLGHVAQNVGGPDVDRYISDLVENEDYTGDPGRADMEARYGANWPKVLKQAIEAAEAIRRQSGAWTDAKVRAGMLSPAAAVKYETGVPGESGYLRRMYAGREAEAANPAMPRATGAGGGMRVPEPSKRRTLDIPVDEARRELTAAQEQLRDFRTRRADEPQPTARELAAAQERVSSAEVGLDEAKATQVEQRRNLGEIREASYRVPRTAEKAAREIAGANLFQNLAQLDANMPDGRKLLHPEWRQGMQDLLAAREAEAWTTDVEANANARDVRQHIEDAHAHYSRQLSDLDAQIAEDVAAGKPVTGRARARRRMLSQQARQASESIPYWKDMEASATDQPARALAQGRIRSAEDAMEAVRRRFKTKGEAGWVTLGEGGGFGPMRGAVVSQDLQPSLEHMQSPDRNPVTRFIRWWKRQKTVFSPGTHVGNTMSNVVMAHMAGLPVTRLAPYMRQALAAMSEVEGAKSAKLSAAGETVQRLRGLGVMGSFAQAEGTGSLASSRSGLGRLLAIQPGAEPRVQDLLSRGHIGEPQSWMERKVPAASPAIRRGRQFGEAVTRTYAKEDDVFRVAMALWRQAQGDAPDEAAQFARKNLIDYRSRSPALRNISQYGLSPFVMYPAKALPTFGRNLLEHPERWATLMAGMAGINELGQDKAGNPINPTDIPPEQRRELFGADLGYLMPGMMQLPMRGAQTPMGAEKIGINPSRWFPTSNLVDRPPPELGYHGILPESWPRLLTPSGPLYEMPATFIANRDPYTGRRIVPPWASRREWATRLGTRAGLNLLSPVTGIAQRIGQNLQEGRGPLGTAGEAAAQAVGLRPNVIQPARYAQRAMNTMADDERDVLNEARRQIATAYRLHPSTAERDAERQRVVKATEESLARGRQQTLDDMKLAGQTRRETEAAMKDAHQQMLDNLRDYDPNDEHRQSEPEEVLFQGLKRRGGQ